MVKIRLARAGAKKRPFYHVVATESRSARDGRFIERLGYYNPNAQGGEKKMVVDIARIEYWKGCGAQVSERVDYLVKHVPNSAAAAPQVKAAGTAAESPAA
ncbi:MAG: 30S ribosomal protein S16 [Sinobacteraceae bacterium]|nr:30S ribosomal protein S16 [Nevskiaceae bacterium]